MLAPVALLALLAASPEGAPDPCRAARAPLPASAGISAQEREVVEDYRAAWRRACDPASGAADLASLLGDAEALAADVSTSRTLEALAAAHAAEAASGAAWPLPAIVRDGDQPLEVDWAAFAALADRGAAEDGRFWRGAARVAGRTGEPGWLGEVIPGSTERCVRLGEVRWQELADALDSMERAGSEPYVRHARALRAALVETLAAIARGPSTCACLPGPGAGALEPLVASSAAERVGTPARRALAKAAADAHGALREGRARLSFLREAPGAPATGCGTRR
jgi:hypothetical protein